MTDLRRELGRKAFHMLSLLYWAAFAVLGWPGVLPLMYAWLAFVVAVEASRLRVPAVHAALSGPPFGGMMRDAEKRTFTGVFHTTVGSLAAMHVAQGRPEIVGTAIGQLALGDAAAALAGKAFGRVRILGGQKSLEGTLAGFAVCYAVAAGFGVPPGAALASAAAASLVELLPTSRWLNDNLWIPVTSAAVLRACLA